MIKKHLKILDYALDFDVDFERDVLNLLTKKSSGHMEKWEYGVSRYKNDPAGGGEHWANLVHNPGHYYLTSDDIENISDAIKNQALQDEALGIHHIYELGPGSTDSILFKTLPFLSICPNLRRYTAIDSAIQQANNAGQIIADFMDIKTGSIKADFMSAPLKKVKTRKNAIIMWGSSLGNISGFAGDNPFFKLVKLLKFFKSALKKGDKIILCFDSEQNEEKVLLAYSELALRSQILSILYRMKNSDFIKGDFNPDLWRHQAVWYPEVSQCAHEVFPLVDQSFQISGHTITIPAWERFNSNNSYKFHPETLKSAAKRAGIKSNMVLQKNAMAMFVGTVG